MGNKQNGLRVLMYHKTIESGDTDLLTVTRQQLEEQFAFFKQEGYNCVSLQEVIDHVSNGSPLKEKPILLTVDDGYKNNLTVLYPLLQQYKLKASIFIVPRFIEKAEQNDEQYMTISEIQSMNPGVVEFGLHTLSHKGYNSLTLEQIEEDLVQSKAWLDQHKINYLPAHAYTYGQFPKNDKTKLNGLFRILEKNGIKAAFNIGNRINALPVKQKFVIQRIDVQGIETLAQFKAKVRKGKELVGFIKDILGKP